MRNGFVLFVAVAFSTCVGYAEAGDKEHDAAVAHLKKVRVDVGHRDPLKQVWLEPRKGEELDRKPLRVWFHDNWILRDGVWVNDGWQPKEVDLGYLPKLQDLYGVTLQFEAAFQAEGIRNDWLRVLKKTPKLKELILHGANFTDECTPHLRDLKELDSLSLTCTRITDKGLENLKELKSLEFISLVGTTGVTDAGFRQLSLKNLRFLNLDDTKVTDKGIAALKDSHDLEWLKLSSRTDKAGLQHLLAMTKLKNLQLQGARATVAEMKAILAVAKDLEFIETGYPEGDYTRKGWKK